MRGAAYIFDRLLLATGGAPRRFPWGGDDAIYNRTLDLKTMLQPRGRAIADTTALLQQLGFSEYEARRVNAQVQAAALLCTWLHIRYNGGACRCGAGIIRFQ